MKTLSRLFLQGLVAILPLSATLAILYWLGTTAEASLGALLRWALPAGWYWPGLGIVTGLLLVTAVGVLVNAYIFRRLLDLLSRPLANIPLVKTIYGSIRDIARFAAPDKKGEELQRAVLVTLNEHSTLIGFITGDARQFAKGKALLPVYVPMSYQIGGFTLLMPEDKLQVVDMGVQDAMRFVLTAGMARTEPQNKEPLAQK